VSDAYANAIWWSLVLARDIDTCCALLAGDPVDPARLWPEWVEYATQFALIRLDTFAVDLLHRRAELRSLFKKAA
jgi:hypothetical protein